MSYLITLAEYKAFQGIASNDTTNDTMINALIPAIANDIDTYLFGTGYNAQPTLIQQTYTETFNGTGNDFLRLRGLPIVSITSVTFDYGTTVAKTYAGSNFTFIPNQGLLSASPTTTGGMPSYFAQGNQNIQVVYVAGYAQASVPQALKRAASIMLQRIINIQDPVNLINSKTLDQLSISYGTNSLQVGAVMFNDLKVILDRFRVNRFIF